ncbi:hypothetical protein EC991_000925 [Linnemannia zychae]|nr:hypothetical protein EC991_000925 [Linnemannia zychae]
MVKFTTLFVATVALLAASASAQVSTPPVEFEALTLPFDEPEGNYTISDNEAGFVHLERRAPKAKGVLSAAEQKSILDAHNKHRARHGVKPLKWSKSAAAWGNDWIQQCQFKHSSGDFGENLAAGYKNFKTGIDAWYNEYSKYNYKKPGFSMGTGHFTQVVWKGTKSVGCAKKFCPGSNWTIYICNYDPPGNYQGQYPKNVLPRKK